MSKFITRCLKSCNPKGIIHVGAHRLQELNIYHEAGVKNIIWIEADPLICAEMQKKYPMEVILPYLVTDKCGERDFFVSSNKGASSAIYPFHEHKKIYPDVTMVSRVELPTETLDTILSINEVDTRLYNMLVMDVQGAELLVLKGATNYIENCEFIISEINAKEMYKGCVLVGELDKHIEGLGFNKVKQGLHRVKGYGDAFYIRGNK